MCNEYLDVVLPVSWGGWIDEVTSIQWWVLDVGQQQSLSTYTGDNQITPKSAFATMQPQILWQSSKAYFWWVESSLSLLEQLGALLCFSDLGKLCRSCLYFTLTCQLLRPWMKWWELSGFEFSFTVFYSFLCLSFLICYNRLKNSTNKIELLWGLN